MNNADSFNTCAEIQLEKYLKESGDTAFENHIVKAEELLQTAEACGFKAILDEDEHIALILKDLPEGWHLCVTAGRILYLNTSLICESPLGDVKDVTFDKNINIMTVENNTTPNIYVALSCVADKEKFVECIRSVVKADIASSKEQAKISEAVSDFNASDTGSSSVTYTGTNGRIKTTMGIKKSRF